MSSYLLYFFRRGGRRVPPRFPRRAAPHPPRVSSAGAMSSFVEVSFLRSKVRRFESFDSLCGSLPPSVFPSGRHPFLLKFSRVGGKSTSLGLLEWAAFRPPPVFSSGRHVCPSRFLRRRGGVSSALTSMELPKIFELSKSRSAVRKFDQPIERSGP